MITKGRHPWDLINLGNGMVRQCPACGGREILDDICMQCGYKPSLQLWKTPPYGKIEEGAK